jgi:two-component system phosphate regulon sensor histidine kinase PhoR
MGTYELVIPGEDADPDRAPDRKGSGSAILLRNTLWFMRLRWLVILVFILAGLLGRFVPEVIKNIGFFPSTVGPWILAGVLLLANASYYFLTRRLSEDSPVKNIKIITWLQIAVDLIVLTILVHVIGSTSTFLPFTYLFHIILACIFFPPKESLLVTILSAGLYISCITLELSGVLPVYGFLSVMAPICQMSIMLIAMFAVPAVLIWFIVWYLISTLSQAIQTRERQLVTANEQLIKADKEITQRVLQTTHELKAPFSGIESNIQVLKFLHWNEIPESIHGIIERIEVRSQTLRERIREILILGDLRSETSHNEQIATVNLRTIMDTVLEEVGGKAKERNVSLDCQIPFQTVTGNEKRLIILFSNLVTNAIQYSHENGNVRISSRQSAEGEIVVSVMDQGIGIDDEALPYIFDEYYRTTDGAKFNRMSTGLGLTIVKEIAQTHRLRINVTSEKGKGTTFEVVFPRKENPVKKEEA